MRIALLSDVHGNPIALQACLARVAELSVDDCYFLGDAVGYLPGEVACVERLRAEEVPCQRGNHEAMMLEPDERARHNESVYRLGQARERLGEELVAELAEWPESRSLRVDGHDVLLVHGSPDDPIAGYVYPDSDLSGIGELPYDAVFMGNTHRPFAARVEGKLVANVGSVGLPRDVGSLACFAVYDTEAGTCSHYRVAFDVDTVLELAGPDLPPVTSDCLRREAPEFVGQVLA